MRTFQISECCSEKAAGGGKFCIHVRSLPQHLYSVIVWDRMLG